MSTLYIRYPALGSGGSVIIDNVVDPLVYDSGTNTLSIKNASASDSGVVTTSAQTFAGSKTFQDQVLIANGTLSSPGLAFTNSPNSGLYVSGVDKIGVAVEGVQALDMGISTGGFPNIGLGVSASASDSFPFLVQRSIDAAVVEQISNANTGSNASAKLQVVSDAGDKVGEVAVFTSASGLAAYASRMTVRPSGNSTGLSVFGGDLAGGDIQFYTGGDYAATGIALTLNADHTLLMPQSISAPTSPSSGVKLYQASSVVTSKTAAGIVSSFAGVNTGDVSLGTANGLSLASQVLSLGLSSTSTSGALSSTDWNTFNGKAGTILPAVNETVYVNSLTGSNVTGTGAFDKPWATVAYAMTQITDAASAKPYVIQLLGVRQTETTDVFVKPYTFINGTVQRGSYIRINGGTFKPDTSHSTANSWVGFGNLYLGGSTGINWDLQALGGSNCTMVIQNCTVTGTFTYLGRNAGGGDYLEFYTGVCTGAQVWDSVLIQAQSLEFGSTVALTNTQAGSVSATFNNCTFDTNVSATGYTPIYLMNCAWAGTGTFTTTGTLAIETFRGLPPTARRSFSGGTTITYRDDATIVPFTPTTSSDWDSVPTNASTALDTLATSGVVKSQSANRVLASPAGSAGLPSFRTLVAADIPSISLTTGVSGVLPIANGGTNNGSLAVTAGGVIYTDGSKQVNVGAGSSGQFLRSNGASAPTWAAPTVTFTAPKITSYTSGSGTFSITGTPLYIRVRMVGGGGGGSGSGNQGTTGSGGAGGDSTFGSSLLTCVGGGGGIADGNGGTAGTASISSPAVGTAINGARGSGYSLNATALAAYIAGGPGANTPFGSGGGGGPLASAGNSAPANSGAGGGGGGGSNGATFSSGSGGGSSGFIDAIIASPSSSYAYAVGASGTAGAAGTSGSVGGAGGTGYIEVTEYYQ